MTSVSSSFISVSLKDFVEIKQQLFNLGLMRSGEPISNIYNSVLEQNSEKTKNIIKVLGMSNEQVSETIKGYISTLSTSELTKMLTLKGMKKVEINQIIEKYKLNG